MRRPQPRLFKGFRDVFAADIFEKQRIVDCVRAVYERYGFLPLETPSLEYVDVLGKFLPESHTPEGGIFALRNPEHSGVDSDPNAWLALRYDLTASLARVCAQYAEIRRPFRRYQLGYAWRVEKPGPGRFREFAQFDFDSVGVPSVAADAEACCVICDAFEALGFARGEYVVKVNNRKIIQGVLERCGIAEADVTAESSQAGTVVRAMDKLERLGLTGVRELLGPGRRDQTGDFTPGAQLEPAQIELIENYLTAQSASRAAYLACTAELVAGSAAGEAGVAELAQMDSLLSALGYSEQRVVFDPGIIRGMAYYTGPVYEGVLLSEIRDEDGQLRQFGTIFGGGRYDNLVERFTGQKVPATGASVGVDRLAEAVKLLPGRPAPRSCTAEVLVTVMDKSRLADYFALAQQLRTAGINAELYLGSGGIGQQLKYADHLGIPLALIAGEDEFARGEWQLKDLRLGRELAAQVESREEWRKGQPAQQSVPAGEVVAKIAELAR